MAMVTQKGCTCVIINMIQLTASHYVYVNKMEEWHNNSTLR